MKRILVPTDFSSTAEKAFRFAVDLAYRAKGTVILYHVYIPVESAFVGTDKTRKEYNTRAEVDVMKRLQRLRKKVMANNTGVAVSTVVGRSPLIDNILGFAEENRVDLIVMGTQGCTGLKGTLLGSAAARVVERSDLPVLLVPEKYEMAAPGQFIFATNFSASDRSAVAKVGEMAKLYNADLTVLHFQNAYNTPVDIEKEKGDFDKYTLYLQKELNTYKIQFHLLEVASVTQTMEGLDKKFPYDVLAMVRRKRTFLERFFIKSFTQNMAYVTNKPLLIIPEEI